MFEKKITSKELFRAKSQLKASTVMSLESLSSRMQNLAKTEFLVNHYEKPSLLIKRIDEISIHDVNACIDKYLDYNNWSYIIFNKD